MTTSINANPNQTITLVVQTLDSYGTRADGYAEPTVDSLYSPAGTESELYPQTMTKISTGLYKHSFTLPSGASALGTYIVSISWPHPTESHLQYETFLIHVAMPFGNSSISPA